MTPQDRCSRCLPCFPRFIVWFVRFIAFFHLFRRHCDAALLDPSSCLSRSCPIPSIYSRSAAQITSFLFLLYLILTRVLWPFFSSSFRLIKSFISFQPKCYPNRLFLFLFLNGVSSTSFISVYSILGNGLTFQGSLVSLVCQRSNLVLPLLFLFFFPPVPS